MSERRPDDVFAKSATVVHRHIVEQEDVDVAWHWGAFKEEALRARESEIAQAEQLRQKDEVIRELTGAAEKMLSTLKAWHKNKGEWWDCQRMLSAALAKAGRKP